MRLLKLSEFGTVVMGMSPSGETYNEKGEGLPLLNGPTEFTNTCPIPKLYTIDSKRECKEGDLIFCVRGSTTGKMNWSDQIYSIGRGVCAIRGNNLIDTKYIRYCIEHNLQGLLSVAGGGTFPNLKKDDIGNFEIPIVDNRKKIVEILSAYDDLIENNLKRIKLLEETAQNIYKEWFVNFRFPNYEHTTINQDTGLPEGWEVKKIEEVVKISGGGTPSTKEPNFWNGEILWFSPTDLGKNSSLVLLDSSKKITNEGLLKSSAKLLPPMTILMSSRATIGLFGMINKECSTNQGFINIIPNEINYRYYILQNLMSRKNEIIGKATGTTFKEISKGVFNSMSILKPPSNIVKVYFDFADTLYKQVESLEIQNQKLKEARDILLPRLMNRTIEV